MLMALVLAGREREKCLQWLGEMDQSAKHEDEYKKSAEGTGNWLLQNEAYLKWKDGPGLLWLKGNGKLSSSRQSNDSQVYVLRRN